MTTSRIKRRTLIAKWFGFSMCVSVIGLSLAFVLTPTPSPWLEQKPAHSRRILDRHGTLLRHDLSAHDTYHQWIRLDHLSTPARLAIIHAEDRRFEHHPGIDPLAILRSTLINIQHGRVKTGASTISQQLVKLTRPESASSSNIWANKLHDSILAIKLDSAESKSSILEHYANRLPYGHGVVGIEAASRYYFDTPAAKLDWARAAFLAVIPRAPTRLDPHENLSMVLAQQRALLHTLFERGVISSKTHSEALARHISIEPHVRNSPTERAHLHAALHLANTHDDPSIHTTLDATLQKETHLLLAAHVEQHRADDISQASAVVLEHATGEVLVHIGSTDYFDVDTLGSNDGVLMRRRPGSTLKPFIYALYLEQGGTLADPVLDDVVTLPTPKGAWSPRNFDRATHGPVSIRSALASSLNIPAVLVASWLGTPRIIETLRGLGFDLPNTTKERHGAGIALGNAEISLLSLAAAYSAFASKGVWTAPKLRLEEREASVFRRIFSEETSYMILSALSDDSARTHGFGRNSSLAAPPDMWIAAKTGTSTGYKDNWAVGITSRYTIAVWAGNFNGSPTREMSGATGAAPLMRQIAFLLHAREPSRAPRPPEHMTLQVVCTLSGQSTRTGCACPTRHEEWFIKGQWGSTGYVDRSGHHSFHPVPPSSCPMHHVLHGEHALDPPASWLEWLSSHQPNILLAPHPHRTDDERARLIEPLDAQKFFTTPRGTASIRLRAIVPLSERDEPLWWWHQGVPMRRATPPYLHTFSNLEVGAHHFALGTRDTALSTRTITITHHD